MVFQNRRTVLAVAALLVAVGALGIPKLSFTPDTRVFFERSDPRVLELEAFEEAFLPSHTILFAIEMESSILQDSRSRVALEWLHRQVEAFQNIRKVDSLVNASYAYSLQGDLVLEPYLDYVCPNECELQRAKVLSGPLVSRRLIGDGLSAVSVIGTFDLQRTETQKIYEITAEARKLKVEFEQLYPGLTLHVSGGIPMSQAFVDAGQRDSVLVFLVAAAIIGVLLSIMLGGPRNAMSMLGTGFCAVAFSMGIAGWSGVELNSASAAAPIVTLTLVVASTMHLFFHYLRLCDDPRGAEFAAVAALNVNLKPILLTTLTSGISLASLVLVDSPPVRDIGVISCIGVIAGGILATTVTPLLLDSGVRKRDSQFNRMLQARLNRYAASIEAARWAPAVVVLASLVAVAGLARLQIDDDFVAYFDDDMPFKQATNFAMEKLTGPNHIEVDVHVDEKTVFDPGVLDDIGHLTARLREYPIVASVVSLSDVQQILLQAFDVEAVMNAHDAAAHEQFFFAYEMGLGSGESVNDLVASDRMRTHIPVFLSSGSAKEIQELESDIYRWAEKLDDVSVNVTGENIPVAHLSTSNIPAVAIMIVSSLLATALFLGVAFRNWKTCLNTLLAIAVPVLCGFGLWGWLNGTIGLAGSIVIAISIGVVIDDAIHLIFHQANAHGKQQEPWESVRTSVYRVGAPIIATTILFVVGLSPLLGSDFGLNVTLAGCTSLILLCSLIFDLGVLPKLMKWSAVGTKGLGFNASS